MRQRKNILCVLMTTAVALFAGAGQAQNKVIVAPTGEYAKIDVRLAQDTIKVLSSGSAQEKDNAVALVLAHPENYVPPVFYAMSAVLFDLGKKDDAAFWFYAGQLRARFDANRCLDISARQAVGVLNQTYGTPINQYALKDMTKLEALIPRVVEWDKATPHNYDARWINLHGMGAVISGLSPASSPAAPVAFTAPKDTWDAIAEKTRADYLSGFQTFVAQSKTRK
ncbi:MAG: hypothetical protein JWQ01_3681 [Massilia sp.]|jgi:hypothetical protein|nr:hypothetical protein [Massilia sp.]